MQKNINPILTNLSVELGDKVYFTGKYHLHI